LFHRSSLQLRSYVSVEELFGRSLFQLAPTRVGSLSTLSSLPLWSFFPCGGEAKPATNLSRLTTQLGSSRATASRLGGKPPRVTNSTMLSWQSNHKCSSYGMALLQLSLALHELTCSLNLFSQPKSKNMYEKDQISQRDVWESVAGCSKALGRV
jgi:hypothetical protein